MNPGALRRRLTHLTLADEARLRRRLRRAEGLRDRARRAQALAAVAEQVAAAEKRVAARTFETAITYPAELPVSQRRDEIAAAIRDHQVVVIAGETGSGKTTQLPKICLELGRGRRGMIGHTQPRRIAARSVAERVAEELGVPLGEAVGYQVRFTGSVSPSTLIKIMTDGILLAETQRDRDLLGYDTIIIDEAHERSLNIDFLLGYLSQLLRRRPELKLIITSATIDPDRFAQHFSRVLGRDVPVVEVSGRTYPVEVRYRPLVEETGVDEDDDEEAGARDVVQAICDAVDELCAEGPGDILVFLSGEREIRDAADALRRGNRRDLEVLPLYARLSAAEQHRVFQPHPGRRVVLATNVAETSLTVPGIRYVVDPGTARISRYSQRLKVQRLPIEPVSQASANQRMGRCGRTADGICIRLYSKADFEARPRFTDPEILRTSLASVILQMAALGLGDIADFPFIDPPDRRAVKDGVTLLHELGAIESAAGSPRLTSLGRRLAALPIDPRLGRMVLEAERNGCLSEVLVIAAALSIQDPRERPHDHREAAAQKHARFKDPDSDFITLLNLWNYLNAKQRELSSNQFRKLCRTDFLNYLRVREWQDLESQLRQVTRSLGLVRNQEPAEPEKIHSALLAGLLSHIGVRDIEKREYVGARRARFAISPGSTLFRSNARWVMAAELVETSRLWARVVARIEPEWAERLAGHLVKRSYSEPHWEAKPAAVMAYEKVTLYGLPLVTGRKVHYGRIDPELSRELFIRHALVEGDWRTSHAFFHENRALLDEVGELEHRARRRDILVDDETLFAFYDERIPPEVVSGRHFDSWWKRARREQPDLLNFSAAMLVNQAVADVDPADYPDTWRTGDLELALSYQFEPGSAADGVTVHIPLEVLSRVGHDFEWQVPGLRPELVTALIRSLPKSVRRNFVPVPEYVAAVLDGAGPEHGRLLDVLERRLRELTGVVVSRGDWAWEKVPDHLRMTYRIEEVDGSLVAEGKDLEALRRQLAPKARAVVAEIADDVEQTGLTAWTPGTLARVIQRRRGRHEVNAYPALVDDRDSVAVRVFDTEAEQARAMWAGTRRLLQLEVPTPIPQLSRRLPNAVKLGLTRYPYRGVPDLLEECVAAALDSIIAEAGGPAWEDEAYARLRDLARDRLTDRTVEVVTLVEKVVAAAHEVRPALAAEPAPALAAAVEDMRTQMFELIRPGFVVAAGLDHLPDLPRYLRAIARRLAKLPADPARDAARMEEVADVQAEYEDVLAALPPQRRDDPDVREIRWMIEEFRVSLFAQDLRTRYPVSATRIRRALDAL
ncbi:MAG TPA: ATP-dependent RNA helicase HrpA [Micromonosporaceae bacterium]|nr:ATP-dependent RNA helicase HrpA [Micromonosporaceae bacterium]